MSGKARLLMHFLVCMAVLDLSVFARTDQAFGIGVQEHSPGQPCKSKTRSVKFSAKHQSIKKKNYDLLGSSSDIRGARSTLATRLLQERELDQQAVPDHHAAMPTYVLAEGSPHQQEENEGESSYEYTYTVKDVDGNDYGHTENRDGPRTWGSYHVLMPDGRLKTVKYWADHTGYHAEVEYVGTAQYPEDVEH